MVLLSALATSAFAEPPRRGRAATPRASRYAAGGADRDGWHAA
ncbi:hypothetical protein PFZ49_05685 [Microbacterium lacticum]